MKNAHFQEFYSLLFFLVNYIFETNNHVGLFVSDNKQTSSF